ncbi:hypothetical protein GCM10010191_47000 [Actinomadura vinacea]|uniref:Uncharacterized protein n=1 Tax=Actinomadura vinacea TaxID=115336 RepID=A0ABN3JGZ0_9ACTN
MTLQTIDTAIEPTARRAAEAISTGFAYFDTYGEVIINATLGSFTPSTLVTVSIVEVDHNNAPMIGAARMTVHNIQPYQGGVQTWVNIEWNSPLRVRVSYFWQ